MASSGSLEERIHAQDNASNHANRTNLPKNRMSLADQPDPFNFGTASSPKNRLKKASTEINDPYNKSVGPNSKHTNHNLLNLSSCFCREVRLSRNGCVSKVVDFSFIPPSQHKIQAAPLPQKGINFKGTRTITEPKSYTLNK